jgi:hypothetical protein
MPSTAVAAVCWLSCTLAVAAVKLLLPAVNRLRLRLLAALNQLRAVARSGLVSWLVSALGCTAARVPLRLQAAVSLLRLRLAKLRLRLAAKLRPLAAVARLPRLPAAVVAK